MLVKIKRDSIKRNPRAFATETVVSLGADIHFEMEIRGEVPDFLQDEKVAFINTRSYDSLTNLKKIEGYLIDKDKIDEVLAIEGATVTATNNLRTFRHRPEPEYLYEYENPTVECGNCQSQVGVKDIESDYEGDEYYYEECPVCHARNTFPEREYEKVGDALKTAIIPIHGNDHGRIPPSTHF